MKYLAYTIFLFLFWLNSEAIAQKINKQHIVTRATIVDGDTIPLIELKSVLIIGPRTFKNKREAIRYSKLIRDVKKVYPYAKLAGIKLKQYNDILIKLDSDKARRVVMKRAEKELKKEFEGDIRKMTFKQGIILLKLIDRETGNTSYNLVKELRGVVTAFFWQSIGRIFGINLKTKYEPETTDKYIEEIVIMIENGTV